MAVDSSAVSGRLTEAIEGVLAPRVENGSLAGVVVMVVDKDGVLARIALGYADIAARKPMPLDALFWAASQTKPVTATAFMMLVDEGKVGLDDPVEKYLPQFKTMWVAAEIDDEHILLNPANRPITVRDILSHMSGMPFASAMEQPTLDLLDLSVGIRSYAMTPLLTQPGEAYAYSNAGINTAGRIMEVVTGMSYEQFLQERLFDPLDMRDSTFWPTPEQQTRLAKSYKVNEAGAALEETKIDQLYYPLDSPIRRPMPAGGLFSTTADMAKFCRMILSGGELDGRRYVTPAAIAHMSARQTPAHLEASYGLGWGVGADVFEHGGAYATGMSIFPKLGISVVFHVQHAGFLGGAETSRSDVEAAVKSVLA